MHHSKHSHQYYQRSSCHKFIEQLDKLLKASNKTKADLIRGANLRYHDLDDYHFKSDNLDMDVVSKVASYFGVTVDFMLGYCHPHDNAFIKDASPDIVTLNEQEAECAARMILSVVSDFPETYSCMFCKYEYECFIHPGDTYFRGRLREKLSDATGIPCKLMVVHDRQMKKYPIK